MQYQNATTHLVLDDAGCCLLANIVCRDIIGIFLENNSDVPDTYSSKAPDQEPARADCATGARLLDDGSCVVTCSPAGDSSSADELSRDFAPHAAALGDEFSRMVAFADLFAAGYEAEAVSPEHDAAFRSWLVSVSPAVERFTKDLAGLNRRLSLAL